MNRPKSQIQIPKQWHKSLMRVRSLKLIQEENFEIEKNQLELNFNSTNNIKNSNIKLNNFYNGKQRAFEKSINKKAEIASKEILTLYNDKKNIQNQNYFTKKVKNNNLDQEIVETIHENMYLNNLNLGKNQPLPKKTNSMNYRPRVFFWG